MKAKIIEKLTERDLNVREKAKELIEQFFDIGLISYSEAKQCALIAVKNIISALDFNQWQNAKIINYYKEVREEIENYE